MDYQPEYNCTCLLDWACQLQRTQKPILLVDEKLGSKFDKVEVERMIRVALLCTNASPSLRPSMSEVVKMLEGTTEIPDVIPESSGYGEDLRFKALRDHHKQLRNSQSQTSVSLGDSINVSSAMLQKEDYSSTSTQDLYDVSMESYLQARTQEKKTELKHAQSLEGEQDLYEVNLEPGRHESSKYLN